MRWAARLGLGGTRALGLGASAVSADRLLVDLERQAPIDVLPDRTADTFAAWLQEQPWAGRIAVMSRDRGGDYAAGARRGAPQAIQVADRFHLVKNGGEVAERVFKRHAAALQCIAVPARAQDRSGECSPVQRSRQREQRHPRCVSTAKPLARAPKPRGPNATRRFMPERPRNRTSRHPLLRSGMNRKTVQTYLAADALPQRPRQARKASILRPYESYLLERWRLGVHNGLKLWREIVSLGYPGTRGNVSRWVAYRRRCERDGVSLPGAPPAPGSGRVKRLASCSSRPQSGRGTKSGPGARYTRSILRSTARSACCSSCSR